MKKILFYLLVTFSLSTINAQVSDSINSNLPYFSIGEYPESKSAMNMVKRMIDGLGYRYYWATETLRQEDLEFKPGETNRTSYETLDHIHNLSNFIHNAAKGNAIERKEETVELTWEQKRANTLNNLFDAANTFATMSDSQLDSLEITFKRGGNKNTVSFWHLINGPIADALNHVGQIVSNRRASGNPLDPRVNVFKGETK